MRSCFAAPVLWAIAITASFAQLPGNLQRQFDEAERRIVRLPPSAFAELPAAWSGSFNAVDAVSRKKPSRRGRITSSKVNLRNPAKPTGRSCVRLKAYPRFSCSGTARRRTQPKSPGWRIEYSFRGSRLTKSGIRGASAPWDETSLWVTMALTAARSRRPLTTRASTMRLLKRRQSRRTFMPEYG